MKSQKERAAEDQRQQIKKLFDLYLAGHKELGFFGKAGVGKTYCADILARMIASTMPRKPNIIAVATVHKAVELLAEKFRYSSTLASLLSIKAVFDKHGNLKFVPTNSLNKEGRSAGDYDIIIVDECSMITKHNLDLLRKKVHDDAVIIYLGDWRQTCPPDSENSEDSLTFNIPAHVNLNIPFRYEGGLSEMNDYIGDKIQKIREKKYKERDTILEYKRLKNRLRAFSEKYPDSIKITDLETSYETMADLDEQFIYNHLVSYRNKTCFELNGHIRNVVKKKKGYNNKEDQFIIGDKVFTKEALSQYSLHPEFKKC